MHRLLSLLLGFAFLGWFSTNHFPPWVSWYSEAPFFAGVLLAAIGTLWLGRGRLSAGVGLPSITWPLLMLLAVLAVQSLSGKLVFFGQSLVIALYLVLCILCQWLGFVHAFAGHEEHSNSRPPVLVVLAWVVLVGAVVSIGLALAQVFQVWESSSWIVRMNYLRRPGGNLGQPNHLATLVVMAQASVAYLLLLKHLPGRTAAVVLLYLIAGLVVTESRTGLLSAGLLCLWWVTKRLRAPETASTWTTFALLVAALVGFHLAWPDLLNGFYGGAGTPTLSRIEQVSTDPRLVIWPQLLEAANLKPWFGWGFGQTTAAHNAVVDGYGYSLAFSYSHNLAIDLVIWVGWPTALAVSVMVIIWLCRRLPAIKAPDAWYGFAIALPLAVHSMLEFPFAYAYLLVPALVGLGAAEASLGTVARWRIDNGAAGLIVVLVAAVATWTAVEYLQVEEEFRKARFRMLRIGPENLSEAGTQPVILTQLGAIVRSSRLELKPGMDPDDLQLLKNIAMHTPSSAPQFRYTTAMALNDQAGEAVRMLRVIRAQHGEKSFRALRDQINEQLSAYNMPALPIP